MNELETVIQEAIERHARECCGHLDMDGRGPELLAELNRRGYQLVRKDPFAKPEWSDATELEGSNEAVFGAHQDGMDCGLRPCRTCAPVPPSDERLAELLDTFQEAAGRYALDKAGGSSREERDACQVMMTARVELVRALVEQAHPRRWVCIWPIE